MDIIYTYNAWITYTCTCAQCILNVLDTVLLSNENYLFNESLFNLTALWCVGMNWNSNEHGILNTFKHGVSNLWPHSTYCKLRIAILVISGSSSKVNWITVQLNYWITVGLNYCIFGPTSNLHYLCALTILHYFILRALTQLHLPGVERFD